MKKTTKVKRGGAPRTEYQTLTKDELSRRVRLAEGIARAQARKYKVDPDALISAVNSKIAEAIPKHDPAKGSFGGFINRVTENAIRDALRKILRERRKIKEMKKIGTKTGQTSEPQVGKEELRKVLNVEGRRLGVSEIDINLVIERFLGEKEISKLAEKFRLPEGTVKRKISVALKRLRAGSGRLKRIYEEK